MHFQEYVMSTNKDQVRGRVKQAKGRIKEVAGKLVGDEKLKAKGKAQKTLGKAQARFGDVKQRVKDSSTKRRLLRPIIRRDHPARRAAHAGDSYKALLDVLPESRWPDPAAMAVAGGWSDLEECSAPNRDPSLA